ncbi:P-loop NTPase fold protein [Nocardia sp. SYP-A9097]|uniref:P-loop NTPase fold protein n=1 Tax=Nocardia sp. SYP-A9097 TaxID=2663237 RepID=UPI0028163C4D|nr:P-loop NTPase fold protein [Nocardia sp. SYP-A9097]
MPPNNFGIDPLAVAVYGEWGSGKTFFMKKIEASMGKLAENSPDIFEAGVQHVRFGAWHYSRGNLWASLIEQIFAKLGPSDGILGRVFLDATTRIDAIEGRLTAAQHQIDSIASRSEQIDHEIAEVGTRHEEELDALKDVRTKNIWREVVADPVLTARFRVVLAESGLSLALDSALDLRDSAREAVVIASRARLLATAGGKWYKSPLAGAAFAGVTGVILMGLLSLITPGSMDSLVAVVAPFAGAGSSAAAWIKRQSGFARKLLEPAERLQRQIEHAVEEKLAEQAAELQRLEAKAASTQAELQGAHERRARVMEELAVACGERAQLTPARIMHDFIAERVASDEYRQHLGIMGAVHHDLVTLSQCLDAAASDPEATVKRIVLYIDDLDRCAPETVMDVLEAVHFLLALPLFIVVVGIDRRVLESALHLRHRDSIACDAGAPTAAEYLEKIFQLSYTLPAMTPDGCRAILRDAVDVGRVPDVEDAGPGPVPETESMEAPESAVPVGLPSSEQLAEALVLTDEELAAVDLVAPLVGANPRRAKRFGNTYAAVRARLAGKAHDTRALPAVIALLVGAPTTVGLKLQQPDTAENADLSLGDWIRKVAPDGVAHGESGRLSVFLSEGDRLLEIPMAAVIHILPDVVPYSQR